MSISQRRASRGMHLIGVNLRGMYLIEVPLIGVYSMGVHSMVRLS